MMTSKILICSLAFASAISASAIGVGINDFGAVGAYTQDFNSLANAGTSSTLPTGWAISESGTGANTSYTADNGSSSTGDSYSYGSIGSTDRALGGLRNGTGTVITKFGVQFQNLTGGIITMLTISYMGEQWRLGTEFNNSDRLDFQYSTTATSLTDGTWKNVNELDFTTPNPSSVGSYDGNDAANRALKSFTINPLSIASGTTFWLRWTDFNLTAGPNAGLAVDDFRLTANGTRPRTVSVPDSLPTGFVALTFLFMFGLGYRFRRQMVNA